MGRKDVCTFIFDLLFRPDRLEDNSYKLNPHKLDGQALVTEACNILDQSEHEVLVFIASQVRCSFSYDDWFKTGEMPPMMLQWLRNNIHHLRNRLK